MKNIVVGQLNCELNLKANYAFGDYTESNVFIEARGIMGSLSY